MIEIEVGDAAIEASGESGERTVVGTTGWRSTDSDGSIGHVPVDATLSGHVSALQFPDIHLRASALDGDLGEYVDTGIASFGNEYALDESVSLPEAEYRLRLAADRIMVYLKFASGADLERRTDGSWHLSFDHPTEVTFGVRETYVYPIGTVTVPPTPAGIARAVSTFPAALRTTNSDRSFITFRTHPPRVELGDRTRVPDGIDARRPDTGIEFVVPDHFGAVLAAASPAFYLGARVEVADRDRPLVRAPEVGLERAFPSGSAFQRELAGLLQGTFLLDSLVRSAGQYGRERVELDCLDDLDLDPERCYEASPAERLETYLSVDYGAVADRLPNWHSAAVLPPTADSARALPYAVGSLATVYTPDAARSDVGDDGTPDDHPMTPPRTGPTGERLVEWGGPDPPWDGPSGAPPGCFAVPIPAYEHGVRITGGDELSVVLVEDGDASDYREALRARRRETDHSIAVDVVADPTRSGLSAVLDRSVDLLVYVGDCDGMEIGCSDGTLAADAVESVGPNHLVLDAPRSRRAGRALVERGAVAAVTSANEDRLDPALLGYLCNGIGPADAVWLARRYHGLSPGATPVGAARGSLRPLPDMGLSIRWIRQRSDGGYVTGARTPTLTPGGVHTVYDGQEGTTALTGTPIEGPGADDPLEAIDEIEQPLFFDGRVYWPDEQLELVNPSV